MRTDDLKSLRLYLFGAFRVNQKGDVALRLSQPTAKVSPDSTSTDNQYLHGSSPPVL
jgi:hypothetical protein